MVTYNLITDLTNLGFGLIASVLAYLNILEAKKHNTIKGIHWASTAFFSMWSAWNVYFYYSLGLNFSTIGSLSIFCIDIYWLYLFFKFKD